MLRGDCLAGCRLEVDDEYLERDLGAEASVISLARTQYSQSDLVSKVTIMAMSRGLLCGKSGLEIG